MGFVSRSIHQHMLAVKMRICIAEKNCMAASAKMQMTKILGAALPLGMPGGAKIVGGPLCRAAKPRIEAGGRRRLLQDARRSPVVVRLQDNQLRQPKTSTTNDGKSIASLHVGSQCSWTDEILNTFLPLFLDRPEPLAPQGIPSSSRSFDTYFV